MAHPFVHVELYTGDLAKAKEFYSKLFDWKLEDMPMPGGKNYTLIKVGEGTGGGMMTSPSADIPPHWLAYVGVEDIVASTKQAVSLGATIKHDIMDIEGAGKMSIITDPTGATLALWEARRDS
jgi:predicted enzyme related to lactoylglutathione lyase